MAEPSLSRVANPMAETNQFGRQGVVTFSLIIPNN